MLRGTATSGSLLLRSGVPRLLLSSSGLCTLSPALAPVLGVPTARR